MGLFNSLLSTANTMRVYERSLNTVQNNVANANTPGYAKQRQELVAQRFDLDVGIVGGVQVGRVVDSRSAAAERSVQQANEQFGRSDQLAKDLGTIEPLFPVTEGAGLPAALNRFFAATSQASVSPNDQASREVILDRAQELATNFNQLGGALADARSNINGQIRQTVTRVNEIAGQLAQVNQQRGAAGDDPALSTKASNLLEELSVLVNYQSVEQTDGRVSLYAAGSLLLIGDTAYPVSLDASGGQSIVRDSQGVDVTAKVTGGRLSGLLESHNQAIPAVQSGLDGFARDFADRVNLVLDGGVDQFGTRPTSPLFTYEDASPSTTFTVNPLTPQQLALASATAPGGNGNALDLTSLSTAKNTDGKTFSETYGDLSAQVGRQVLSYRDTAEVHGQIYAQAKSVRQETQGVSLNEEAAQLIQAQRAYQAAAQLFRTLNDLTEAAINIGR
ncbi:MAG: flagellar hook-associated protein FlgK [Bryobacteraceae bacterium]|nr:flagellar hook-associated protein FlgK [Bryobacteraceae bacterium]